MRNFFHSPSHSPTKNTILPPFIFHELFFFLLVTKKRLIAIIISSGSAVWGDIKNSRHFITHHDYDRGNISSALRAEIKYYILDQTEKWVIISISIHTYSLILCSHEWSEKRANNLYSWKISAFVTLPVFEHIKREYFFHDNE